MEEETWTTEVYLWVGDFYDASGYVVTYMWLASISYFYGIVAIDHVRYVQKYQNWIFDLLYLTF